ncbi:MAG: tetratricopeptide repeat protein, partial [Myxococcota bacterium]
NAIADFRENRRERQGAIGRLFAPAVARAWRLEGQMSAMYLIEYTKRLMAGTDIRWVRIDGSDDAHTPQAPLGTEVKHGTGRQTADWHRAGQTLLAAQRYREAREILRRAVEVDPTSVTIRRDYHVAAGYELRQAGRFEEAAVEMQRALEIDPDCREALAELRTMIEQRKIRRTTSLGKLLGR